jgi:hypothetical protein
MPNRLHVERCRNKIGGQFGKKGRAGPHRIHDAAIVKAKHIFLALSVITTSVAISAGGNIYLDVGLPLGMILFGLFLVATVMEKESALYDAQLAEQTPKPSRHAKRSNKEVAANNPVLTHAPSH